MPRHKSQQKEEGKKRIQNRRRKALLNMNSSKHLDIASRLEKTHKFVVNYFYYLIDLNAVR